jgi:hypothetical protein
VGNAVAHKVKHLGRRARYVDDAAGDEGPPIIYLNCCRATVVEILD